MSMNIPDETLVELYGAGDLRNQRRRYLDLAGEFGKRFGPPGPSPCFVSAPGRTELGGNHTDHNHGKVLCAAVSRDTMAIVAPRSDNRVKLKSSAFPEPFDIDLSNLEPRDEERGSTDALVRGVAAGLQKHGRRVGGFNAAVHSNVGIGSGLSSSASFEVLVGGIFNALYNEDGIDPVELAGIGQFAENAYFGKPCGLMDQIAGAVGGILTIDFEDNKNPVVERIEVDFTGTGFVLAVVDTGAGHADLTPAYASIPGEMKQVASLFGKGTLREIGEEMLRADIGRVRAEAGDRALLRALHFFAENRRVERMVGALKAGEFDAYLRLVAESGASSAAMLQNTVAPGGAGNDQPAALAIGVSDDFFRSRGRGVCRIHGGGFAGTIQAYIPEDHFGDYSRLMEALFGEGCVQPLRVRMQGVAAL